MAKVIKIDLGTWLLVAFMTIGGYFSYRYAPILWKKIELSKLIREQGYGARRTLFNQVKESIIKQARDNLRIELFNEDISVDKLEGYVKITVIWRPVMQFPFEKEIVHKFVVEESLSTYD